jgi:hypothetical protein
VNRIPSRWAAASARAFLTGAAILAFGGTAGAQIDTSRSMLLAWTAPGDDGYQGQVSSYHIRYQTAPPDGSDEGSVQAWWDGVSSAQRIVSTHPLASAGSIDSVRVTGLAPSTTYYFMIRAFDDAGNGSEFSNIAQGTTAPACIAPASAPGSFAAAADSGQVVLSWAPTTDPAAVLLYLYRSVGASGAWSLIQTAGLSATGYTDTNVQPGTTYRYRAAWMGAECEGPTTSVRTVTTPGIVPTTPESRTEGAPSIRAYPNPSSGPVTLEIHVAGASSQHARIRLYDMKGRWIADLADGEYPPGLHVRTWNGASRTGEKVGAGYYELVGRIGDEKVRERIVILP